MHSQQENMNYSELSEEELFSYAENNDFRALLHLLLGSNENISRLRNLLDQQIENPKLHSNLLPMRQIARNIITSEHRAELAPQANAWFEKLTSPPFSDAPSMYWWGNACHILGLTMDAINKWQQSAEMGLYRSISDAILSYHFIAESVEQTQNFVFDIIEKNKPEVGAWAAHTLIAIREVPLHAKDMAYQHIKRMSENGVAEATSALSQLVTYHLISRIPKTSEAIETINHLDDALGDLISTCNSIRNSRHINEKEHWLAHYSSSALPATLLSNNRQISGIERKLISISNDLSKSDQSALTNAENAILQLVKSLGTPLRSDMLRRYHVSKMNDPSEGHRLLNFKTFQSLDSDMKLLFPLAADSKESRAEKCSARLKEWFEKHYFLPLAGNTAQDHTILSDPTFSPISRSAHITLPSVYLTCFSEQWKNQDRLDLWRFYGQDATGCCIGFHIRPGQVDYYNESNLHSPFFSPPPQSPSLPESGGYLGSNVRPPIYQVKYDNESVCETLAELWEPLHVIEELTKKLLSVIGSHINDGHYGPDEIKADIERTVVNILLELIYLYKDSQYATENEWRSLRTRQLGDQKVKLDEAGYLYDETEPFLFSQPGAHIIIGPKHPNPERLLWELRFLLKQHGLERVEVSISQIQYR